MKDPVLVVLEQGGLHVEVTGTEWLPKAIAHINVVSVTLHDTRLGHLELPPAFDSVTTLILDCPMLRTIDPGSGCTALEHLWISGSELESFEFVQKMPVLTWLSTKGDRCSSLDGLEGHKGISMLLIPNSRATQFAAIGSLDKLKGLSLINNICTTLDPMLRGKAMEMLSLARTQVTTLHGLDRIEELGSLSLSECDLQDLTQIEHAALASLHMRGTRCPSYQALGTLRNVVDLNLQGSNFPDPEVLAGCVSLEGVDLRATPVASLQPLLQVPRLRVLRISPDMAALDGVVHLRENGVHIEIETFPSRRDRKALRDLSWSY